MTLVDPTLILDPVDWNHAAGRGLGTTPILDWIECTCLLLSKCGRHEPINLRNMITTWEEAGLSLNPPATWVPLSHTTLSGADGETGDDDYPDNPSELQSDSTELLLEQLSERGSTLGNTYPFHISKNNGTISFIDDKFSQTTYAHLLLLCAIERYGRNSAFSHVTKQDDYTLRIFFESIVLFSLRKCGYDCEQIGTGAGSGRFADRLQHTLQKLGLGLPNPSTQVRQRIQDGGADILAGHFWKDGRSREVVHVIQCTVSPPSEWPTKLNEASALHWLGLLNQGCPGIPCLATPFEATVDARHQLQSMATHSYMDRIRLTRAAQDLDLTTIPKYSEYFLIINTALSTISAKTKIT